MSEIKRLSEAIRKMEILRNCGMSCQSELDRLRLERDKKTKAKKKS